VLVAPGSAFVAPGAPDPRSVRVAFCGDRDATVEGVRRLVLLATALREKVPSHANLVTATFGSD